MLLLEARTATRAAELALEPMPGRHALLFVEGFGAVDGHRVGVGTLVSLRAGAAPRLRLEPETTVLVFGGEPLGTRVMQGNVIASSTERLERALRVLP